MGLLWALFGFAIVVVIILYIFGYFTSEPKPPEPKTGWWGRGPVESSEDSSIKEFQVGMFLVNIWSYAYFLGF